MTLAGTSPVFGPPTITLAEWTAALASSPVAPNAAALYALVVAAGMDPAVALGQFAAESSYGTKGYAVTTHNWGNNLWASWTAQFGGTPYAPGNGYTYVQYPDWTHGMQAYLYLMGQYRTWGWATNLTTMVGYWLSGSPTVTPRVTQYVNNIISAAQSAALQSNYLPAFQTERDEPAPWDDCTRRSVGMLVDWMTHGATVTNGEGIPATGGGTPGKGATDLATAAAWVKLTFGIDIGCLYASPPTFAQLQGLTGGMVVQGLYGAVPAPYDRWDPTFTGGHAVFAYHDADGFFVMDPLGDPAQGYRGETWPDDVVQAYAYGLSGNQTVLCAVPATEDQVVTLTGTPGYYDAPLGAQIYALDGVTPLTKLDYYPPSTGIYSPGATSPTQRAVIIDHGGVKGMVAVMNLSDLTLRGGAVVPVPSPTPTPAPVITILNWLPAPLAKFLQDAAVGAAEGVAVVNLAPYLPVAGSQFTLHQGGVLAVVLFMAALNGIRGRAGNDLPALLNWLAGLIQPVPQPTNVTPPQP